MTATKRTPNTSQRLAIANTQELRDALFYAICLLDHANPENDTDFRDVAAGRELATLRTLLNEQAWTTEAGYAHWDSQKIPVMEHLSAVG
jgi:hypothetical protein